MNTVLISMAECGVRVSLVAAATLGVVALVGHRRPAVRAAITSVGLVSILLLTLLAAMPLPNWWRWDLTAVRRASEPSASTTREATAAAGPARHQGHAAAPPAPAAGGAQLDIAAAARRLVGSRPLSVESPSAQWPIVVLAILAGGAALGVARLGWSLATALRIGRQSHPIPDAGLPAHLWRSPVG